MVRLVAVYKNNMISFITYGAIQKSADTFETMDKALVTVKSPTGTKAVSIVFKCFKCVSCDDDSELTHCVKHM